MAKRVLITGHEGYIGSVMAPAFIEAGYEVVGLDAGYYRECNMVPPLTEVPSVRKDIRDLEAKVHTLVSRDPLGRDIEGRKASRFQFGTTD